MGPFEPIINVLRARPVPRVAASGTALLCICIQGCTVDPPYVDPAPRACAQPTEVPGAYLDCQRDENCPAGSSCVDSVGECNGSATCQCRAEHFPRNVPDVLIRGFQVPEFELRRVPGVDSEFEWEAPEEASYVVCGLFVNAPQVSGGRQGRITNHDKSLYRTHVFGIPSGTGRDPRVITFSLSSLSRARHSDTCDIFTEFPPLVDSGEAYPAVTTLRVGCWAYHRDGVLAATRLRNVRLTDLNEIKPPVSDCASIVDGEPEGRFCIPQRNVGRCHAQTCLPVEAWTDRAGSAGASGADPSNEFDDQTPVADCSEENDGAACILESDFSFGRCVGNRCANQDVRTLALPLVISECALPGQATDWLNCFDHRIQGYGTCLKDQCRLRCVTDSDCGDVATFLDESTGPLHCAKVNQHRELTCASNITESRDASYLGVCVPAEVAACD